MERGVSASFDHNTDPDSDKVIDIDDASTTSSNLKNIGSVENYQAGISAVRECIFDGVMQIVWNAVFYDHVTDCVSAWRKTKLWSKRPVVEATSFSDEADKVCISL